LGRLRRLRGPGPLRLARLQAGDLGGDARGGDREDEAGGLRVPGAGDPHDAAVLRARAPAPGLRRGRSRHRLRGAAARGVRAAGAAARRRDRRRGDRGLRGAAPRAQPERAARGERLRLERHRPARGARGAPRDLRMIYDASVSGRSARVEVRGGAGRYTLRIDGTAIEVSVSDAGPGYRSLLIGATSHELGVEREGDAYRVSFPGASVVVTLAETARGGATLAPREQGPSRLTAPMPGRIVRVLSSA